MEKPENPIRALHHNGPIHPYEILTVQVFYPAKTAPSN
jgi:hypothetical protein